MSSTSRGLAVLMVSYLLLAIESPLLQELRQSYFAPDLALLVVVWVGLNMNATSGALTCFFLGFLKDGFVMGCPVGMHMEIFVIVFFLTRIFVGKVQLKNTWILIFACFVASLLASLLFALLLLLFDPHFTAYELVFRLMLPVALVTAPFAPAIFYVLERIDRMFLRRGRDTLFG